MPHPREARVEARCCKIIDELGGLPVKLGSFVVGLPDRLLLLPGGGVWFVEFKALDGVVSPRQRYVFSQLARLGHPVSVVRSVSAFIEELTVRRDGLRRL